MKIKITILIALFCASIYGIEAQNFLTKGTVTNNGTMIFKNRSLNQEDGHIKNDSGHIIIDYTSTKFSQDTLMGRIDFIYSNPNLPNQFIPQITYWDIRLSGVTQKTLSDPTKNLFSLSRFVSDSVVQIEYDQNVKIGALGYVTHNGQINYAKRFGRFSLIGLNASQDIDGTGRFKELELDNSEGADVISGGGFRVNTSLQLFKGEFRNSDTANFAMLDTSMIIRWSGASILNAPIFEQRINVKYKGNSAMDIGPEIPLDTNILQDLFVENVGGITLTRDATANRDIVIESVIKTERDTNLFVLTSTAEQDPQFLNADAEIIGSFRRTKLRYDNQRMLFNNRYTYILFGNFDDANGIDEMTLRVRPQTLPPNGDVNEKVVRDIFISAKDINDSAVTSALRFELGYGWRHSPGNPARHETGALNLQELILQRWTGNDWEDNTSSQVPQLDGTTEWAYASATTVTQLGQFAIGISATGQLFIYAKAILEGAYRWGNMATDLRKQDLIPNTPPDVYPHNADPNRNIVRFDNLPVDAVDWVFIEFLNVDISDKVFYKHCLLLADGSIIDSNGKSIKVPESGTYSITLKHRNHLAVMTNEDIKVYPSKDIQLVDFSDISQVYSGATALKPVLDKQNNKLWALFAGDINGDGLINEQDLEPDSMDDNLIWDSRNILGYKPWDVTLSGIIHTRDLNMSWNNRGKFQQKKF
jgi:hypothetical protein